MRTRLSPDIVDLLKQVVETCDHEDRSIRERQIRTWRRLKLYWEGFQRVWYSEVAHDWRIFDEQLAEDNSDQSYYDKPINVFRAYLESIIAALSVTVPPIKCYPDDAENTLDLQTARAGDKIAQLIFRHNDVPLLWLHALFIYCTEGMIACYSYPKEDEKYGTYEDKKYEEAEVDGEVTSCPACGFKISEKELNPQIAADKEDEFMPYDEPAPETYELSPEDMYGEGEPCPACGEMMMPQVSQETFVVTRLVGVTKKAKTRMCMEAYGGLYVKIPNYARTQEECPYLIYSFETNYVNSIEKYKDKYLDDEELRKAIESKGNQGSYDQYDQWGRLSPQYQGEYPENVITEKHAWLRPAAYNFLPAEDADELRKKFPKGVKVSYVGDCFADAKAEVLDDCWTITKNPLSDFVHHDPLGLLLTSIQDITNDLISMTQQTIEHGVGLTFFDPAVLNQKAFEQTEVIPGGMFPATPKSGKSLGDGFFEVKTATLSGEVLPFGQQVQSLGQLVVGAMPSIFGGELEGSGTASEYSMSRAQSLQRLQNTWKMLTIWWKTIFGKVIPMFIQEVKDDERDVQRNKDGNFFNVLIRKAELEGKIGKVELEANENLPMTWHQIKDVVMTLLQTGQPEILNIIGAPENLPAIRSAIGLTDFFVPDEDEVEDTYDIIKQLMLSEPIMAPPDPMMEQMAISQGLPVPPPTEMPSVEPEPDIDNPALRFRICRGWLLSEAGRQAKMDNGAGYRNVLLYAKAQKMLSMPPPMAPNSPGAENLAKPTQLETREAPITEENHVQTIQ